MEINRHYATMVRKPHTAGVQLARSNARITTLTVARAYNKFPAKREPIGGRGLELCVGRNME